MAARLADCRTPFLIGVRHHSPACAAAMGPLLDELRPTRLFLELPVELQGWLEWLGHPDTQGPVALAAVEAQGQALAFYPFADFSPELAAVRWAVRHHVPIDAFDLPLGARAERSPGPLSVAGVLIPALCEGADAADSESLWDRLVEARAPGATPDAVRRASLLVGYAMRADSAESAIAPRDLSREQHMRARLEAAGVYGPRAPKVAAIVGAFHAPALLPTPLHFAASPPAPGGEPRAVTTSLIAYAFDLLDSRSGYPAGIRDPTWQQAAFDAYRAPAPTAALDDALCAAVVDICRDVRRRGHVAGTPDAEEAVRLARDLATLRGLGAPSRRELVEAIQTTLGRGEPLGFGRVLAKAMDEVLVGRRRGALAPGTPRSGLLPHVEALLGALGLPQPGARNEADVELRLDPSRSDLDRRRVVALERLLACGVPYAERQDVAGLGGADALTSVWKVRWQPATEALLELAGLRGVTLEQAATGMLRAAAARAVAEERLDAGARLRLLETAARCGLGALVREGLEAVEHHVLPVAGLIELLQGHALLERLERGHVPGLPRPGEPVRLDLPGAVPPFELPSAPARDDFLAAAVRAVEGLVGSESLDDVHAVADLVETFRRQALAPAPLLGAAPGRRTLGEGRLGAAVDRLATEGAPTMQGAGTVAQLVLGRVTAAEVSERLGSWLDAGVDPPARQAMARRLRGALLVGGTLMESDAALLDGALARVEALDDDPFLQRLPSLREGFSVLSVAARARLLATLLERLGAGDADGRGAASLLEHDEAPEQLGRYAAADLAGRAALDALGWTGELEAPVRLAARGFERRGEATPARPERGLSTVDRWRLILGRERQKLAPRAAPLARALDELYGRGHGEGSRGGGGEPGAGGGRETSFPTVREWAEELDALFGAEVREEVLGRATVAGRPSAALELDGEAVRPSVELLEQLLALKGALGEAGLERLRRLTRHVVDQLVKALATRVQPALFGLTTPRPTRRRGGRLDLRQTVAENLRSARRVDGEWRLFPERLSFRRRARRSIDWRVILAVDVSGSMEPSIIYSAMMAAILARLPAVSVHFLAFSTEVVDLSQHVDDPLALLLEVRVGGGTHIAKALRFARQLITVPSRTVILTVSDFEEGFPVEGLLAEVRALAQAGVKQLGLAALDDAGRPRYQKNLAELVVGAGMPIAALTPLELARWVGEQLR